jgi:hypothetical protein
MIVQEPIEALSSRRDIVSHNLAETLVVGYNEEVDHNDIAEFEAIDEVGHADITKSIENNKSGFGIGLQVTMNHRQYGFGIL